MSIRSSNRSASSSSGSNYESSRASKRQKSVSMFMERYKQRRLNVVNENRENMFTGSSSCPDLQRLMQDKESLGVLVEHIYKDYKESPAHLRYPGLAAASDAPQTADMLIDAHGEASTTQYTDELEFDPELDPEEEERALLRDIEEYLQREHAEQLERALELEGVWDCSEEWDDEMDGSDTGLLCPCCQRQIMSVENEVLFCFNCSASVPLCGQVTVVGDSAVAAWGVMAPTGGNDAAAAIGALKLRLQEIYGTHDGVCKSFARSHMSCISPKGQLSAASLQFSPHGRSCVLGKCEFCGFEVVLR
jgi:hypothetical protein